MKIDRGKKRIHVGWQCVFLALAACAGTPSTHLTPPPTQKSTAQNSTIEIQYVLGHSHYRLVILAQDGLIRGNTYVDHRARDKGDINPDHYPDFFAQTLRFLQLKSSVSPEIRAGQPCRTPFRVTLQAGSTRQTVEGCRSADEGNLSQLVRDGEFLLYSKN